LEILRFKESERLGLIYMSDYLNRPDVRKALHIPDYVQPYPPNSENSTILNSYQWHMEAGGYIYDILSKYSVNNSPKYRILHLFGNTDGQLSLYGVRQWIKSLQWKVTSPWTPWYSVNG
jgi:cathepsin A (carboxypeptidase C)